MKRVNISLTDEDYRRLELAAKEAHNSKKRMAELYVLKELYKEHRLPSTTERELVAVLRNILAECTNPRAAYGRKVNEMCRVALAPYGEEE